MSGQAGRRFHHHHDVDGDGWPLVVFCGRPLHTVDGAPWCGRRPVGRTVWPCGCDPLPVLDADRAGIPAGFVAGSELHLG